MTRPRIAVLGAGPAGLGAAYLLARRGLADVTVLERNGWLGGNTASFELAGVRVDYGSHRLHPACDPVVLADIRALLGDELLDRPRHGQIRLRGRWIHFPLKPYDLALRLPPGFAFGVARDLVRKIVGRAGSTATGPSDETFATILANGLGRTICRDFYFPYARKIWGLEPAELAAIQAVRRVSAGSLGKLVQKVAAMLPGRRRPGVGRFYYPRRGYGQIAEAYGQAAEDNGARIVLNATVEAIEVQPGLPCMVRFEHHGRQESLEVDHVWSTIPITALARALIPAPPADHLDAAKNIEFRAMLLIYLVLAQERFSPFDAHYFPETDIPISRLSEPKNFSAGHGAQNVTVLCAELPCSPTDPVWSLDDQQLGQLLCDALKRVGKPVTARIQQVATRRVRQAYPIYRRGYEQHFQRLDSWISRLPTVLTFGRQGLFSHDNLHHALYMAYSAVDCLGPDGQFDRQRWASYRRDFETHVVED